MADFLLWSGIALILYAIYKWLRANDDYFEKRGLPYLKPKFILGSAGPIFFKSDNLPNMIRNLYNTHPTEKLFGLFLFRKPFYFLRDPAVIKQLAVKDFDYFQDHQAFVDEKTDILIGNSLFLMKGDKWRDMRATLSPAFTGSKMRQMFELVLECARDTSAYLRKQAEGNERRAFDCEMKELSSKYTINVISSTAFGINVNSFEDDNNEFYIAGQTLQKFNTPLAGLKMFIMRALPSVAQFFDIAFFDARTRKFFKSMVLGNIATRQREGLFRPDMINILMNVRSGNAQINSQSSGEEKGTDGFSTVEESNIGKKLVKREWSDDEIVSQCFLFFFAGFDTTSTCLSFAAHELAIHSDCQDKLYEEISAMNKELNGQPLTYDGLQKMKYMDMVISEVLRLWPPLAVADRECAKDYDYDDGEYKMRIEKGTVVWIPINGLHHDEKYFPRPDVFDPERFSEENVGNIVPGTFLGFGIGPRNCIGSRLALMKVKSALYYLLLNFKFEANSETQIPLKIQPGPFNLMTEKGINLRLKLRE